MTKIKKRKNDQLNDSSIFFQLVNGEIIYPGDVKKIISGELTVQRFKTGYEIATRTSIINHLIKIFDFKSYLEIGVRDCKNFDKIIISNKIGIDPKPRKANKLIYIDTSDNYFKKNKKKFDLIFIDGLHLEEQVSRDIENSLNSLNDKGCIIMHDCNPPTEFHQREIYEVEGKFPAWNGTTWRSFAKLRMTKKNLQMFCINCDWGVGIIKKGSQNIFESNDSLSYSLLDKNRKKILNLISVSEFLNIFN